MIAMDLIASKVDPAPAAEAKLIAPIEDVSTPNIPAIATPTIAPENIRRNVLRFRVIFFSLKVSGVVKSARILLYTIMLCNVFDRKSTVKFDGVSGK